MADPSFLPADTRPGTAPHATRPPGPVDDLIALGRDELAAGSDASAALDLRLRLSLLAWDVRGDPAAAATWLAGVDHAAASALRLQLALCEPNRGALVGLIDEVRRRGDPRELAELGEHLLWRGEFGHSTELLRAAGTPARELLTLVLCVAGDYGEAITLLEQGDDRPHLLRAAHLAGDRVGARDQLRGLLRRAAKRPPSGVSSDDAYFIVRSLEAGLEPPSGPVDERVQLLRAKIDLLGDGPGVAAELQATRFELATALESCTPGRASSDPPAEADALLAGLASGVDFGGLLALHARERLALARRDFAVAAQAMSGLAERTHPGAWSRAMARRAAELLEARVADLAGAEQVYAELHAEEPANLDVAQALVTLLVKRGAVADAARVLASFAQAGGGVPRESLVRAARAAEAAWLAAPGADGGGEAAAAAQAIDALRGAAGPAGEREALEAAARSQRRQGQRGDLARTYRQLVGLVEPRRGAAHLFAAGVLALEEGQLKDADSAFREAITREPRDLLSQAGRALVAQAAGDLAGVARALLAQVDLVISAPTQATLLLRHARVALQLGDAAAAEASSARALPLAPEEPGVTYELSQLSAELGRWEQAVTLRERAGEAIAGLDPRRAAGWLCEVGALIERHLADDERARAAYERARTLDDTSRTALRALAALHRRHQRAADLLAVLRAELQLPGSPTAQIELHLAIAATLEAPGATGSSLLDEVLAAYRGVLQLDSRNPVALAAMERICRREGRWSELAEALSQIPQGLPEATLRALGDAYEHLGQWARLAEVHEQLLLLPEVAWDGAARGRASRTLAELYEYRLDDLDAAARAWHRADEAADDLDAVRALQRIYKQRGRQADLAAAIERELQLPVDKPRAVELWRELGELRRSHLGKLVPAAEAYERAVELGLAEPVALDESLAALADLYTRLDRATDLDRVLAQRAAITTDPRERAALLLQRGELLEKTGDLDAAIAAYAAAFELDPASRAAFTTFERACYRRERWGDALRLYDQVIELVEVQRSRAYRLSDLHARRGQVLLQYLADPVEAAKSWLRVLELDPDSDAAQTSLERIYVAASDWPSLIAAYEQRAGLLGDDAKRSEVLRRAARVAAAKLRDPRRAAQLYERLHAVDPTDGEALDAIERHYEGSRDWDKLVEVLRMRLALTAGGDDAIKLYQRIAVIDEESRRDPQQAIDAWRKILDIAPSHREALDALGRLYEGTERWAEFIDITRRQIRVVTDRAQKALLYFKCGSVMESKFSKDEDAIRYYDAAIRTSPSCLPAVHGLRDLYLRRQDWPKVVQSLELEAKLWTDDKERAGVLAHIGTIYDEKLGDSEQAIRYFEQSLSVDRNCLAANRSLFEVYFARGDFARALPLGQTLTQKVMREGDPTERSDFYRKRGIVARETGDLAAAAESFVVSLEIRPDNLGALELLVDLCRRHPEVYDFATTFRELEKVCRKREAPRVLARVLVGRAARLEREYSIDEAETLYREAITLAPDDFPVIDALVDLDLRMRRYETAAAVLDAFLVTATDPSARARARLRQADVYGDGAMDPRHAADALRALIREQPEHREAHFRLATELYLIGAFAEAQRACERLIQIAAAPGDTSPPEDLARYYDYLGRVTEALGDATGAARSYRRAVDLDPAYAPSVLSLMRRAAGTQDMAQAGRLADEALATASQRGAQAVLPLVRGLARFHEWQGDRQRAIDLYRQILARDPDGTDDRVALAALCAHDPALLQMARDELQFVLSRDLRHAPAYRLLMQIYARTGEMERGSRVAAILQLLGYAGSEEQAVPAYRPRLRRGSLTDALRRAYLMPQAALGPLTEAMQAAREPLEAFYRAPELPKTSPITDPGLRVSIVDVQRLLGTEAEILLGERVPGGSIAFESPRPTVILDAAIMVQPDAERRFLIGRALEPIRGGFALPLRLRPELRGELGQLLLQFLRPAGQRDAAAQAFLDELPRRTQRALERLQEVAPAGSLPPPGVHQSGIIDGWYDALRQAADRTGLIACDDIGAAVGMLAWLAGEELALFNRGAVALGLVPGDADLVRFFLSDAYQALRAALSESG